SLVRDRARPRGSAARSAGHGGRAAAPGHELHWPGPRAGLRRSRERLLPCRSSRALAADRLVFTDPILRHRHPDLPRARARSATRQPPYWSRCTMILFRALIIAAAVACLLGTSPSNANDTPASRALAAAGRRAVVDAPAGRMKGILEGNLRVFKGVQYARPPVGKLRWKPPQPLPRWQGVRTTTEFGPACFQPSNTFVSVYVARPMPMSEDCLTLNIWAPADAHDAPVFFWIYGGALWGGASRDPLYDGARLAEHGVIVVSINYRLGVLGWLAHPQLSAESAQGVSGNYGVLDQIAALE